MSQYVADLPIFHPHKMRRIIRTTGIFNLLDVTIHILASLLVERNDRIRV